MLISLTDFFWKRKLSVFNNDCWNFYKSKQQYELMGLISQIFTLKNHGKNDIYQMIL